MSESLTLDELNKRGFAGRSGFGRAPALVIVDFVSAFTTPTHQLGSDVSEEIAETNYLTRAFRHVGHPVIYTTIEYETAEEAATSNWSHKIAGVSSLFAGSADAAQDERLERLPTDPIIAKQYASAFFSTELHDLLQKSRVDTVVLAGCSTSGCVRATAVDACQYGYKAVICREAVADRHRDAHEQALIDVDLKYGDVLDRAEIMALLTATQI